MVEQSLFIILTLAVTIGIEWLFPRGSPQIVAAGVLILFVMYCGPIVFGSDWYHTGYEAGLVFGGFLSYVAFCSKPEIDDSGKAQ